MTPERWFCGEGVLLDGYRVLADDPASIRFPLTIDKLLRQVMTLNRRMISIKRYLEF